MPTASNPKLGRETCRRIAGSSPWTFALLFVVAIFFFAILYALMPEDFYHANLKLEKKTQENRGLLKQELQKLFRRTSQSGYQASVIAKDTGLLANYAGTLVTGLEVDQQDFAIRIELQIPASETDRNWTNAYGFVNDPNGPAFDVPFPQVLKGQSNWIGFSIRMAVVDIPTNTDIGRVEFAGTSCVLSLKQDAYIGERMWGASVRTNMNSLLYGLFDAHVEGGIVNPITTSESEISSIFFHIPLKGELENLTKICVSEAKGQTSGFCNSFGRMLYFSIVTIATLGYGDITPISGRARFASGCEVVVGLILAGCFINAFFNRVSNRSNMNRRVETGVDEDSNRPTS